MSNFIETMKECVQLRARSICEFSNIKPNSLDFLDLFKNASNPTIIAEIKLASPSHGKIYQGKDDVLKIADDYLRYGASGLSILTEPHYFEGNIEYINKVRKAFPNAHILQKDFILSEIQIAQGLIYGTNAVLLIVAFLEPHQLKNLYNYAIFLGLTPIIEVIDCKELEIALELNPKIIAVNNRNLKTLEINLKTAENLIAYVPKNCYAICASGIENHAQLHEMESLGFDGFLIGSHLMKHKNPGKALQKLIGGNYAS